MKMCNRCKEVKDYICFSKDKYKDDGFCTLCKDCKSKYRKNYHVRNAEKLCSESREWYSKNKERAKLTHIRYRNENIEFCRALRKKQYWDNTEKAKEDNRIYAKDRARTDHVYRERLRCRKIIWDALKYRKYSKKTKAYILLGCEPKVLIKHVEGLFRPGMTWENYGVWHIDHIKPLALAKTCEEVKKFCYFSNLQPLWSDENIRKGSSYDERAN